MSRQEARFDLFIPYIFNYLINRAIKNKAQGIESFCAYGLTVLYAMNCIGGHTLLIYKIILCNSL